MNTIPSSSRLEVGLPTLRYLAALGWKVGSSNLMAKLIEPSRKSVLGKTAGHSKMDHPLTRDVFQGKVGNLQPSNLPTLMGRSNLVGSSNLPTTEPRAALAEARHTTTEEATHG